MQIPSHRAVAIEFGYVKVLLVWGKREGEKVWRPPLLTQMINSLLISLSPWIDDSLPLLGWQGEYKDDHLNGKAWLMLRSVRRAHNTHPNHSLHASRGLRREGTSAREPKNIRILVIELNRLLVSLSPSLPAPRFEVSALLPPLPLPRISAPFFVFEIRVGTVWESSKHAWTIN